MPKLTAATSEIWKLSVYKINICIDLKKKSKKNQKTVNRRVKLINVFIYECQRFILAVFPSTPPPLFPISYLLGALKAGSKTSGEEMICGSVITQLETPFLYHSQRDLGRNVAAVEPWLIIITCRIPAGKTNFDLTLVWNFLTEVFYSEKAKTTFRFVNLFLLW